MGIKVKQVRSEPVPTGEYRARIADVTEEVGQFGPQLKFKYELLQPGYEERQLVGWASKSFTPKSKLYALVRAAFGGREIPPDWDFDSDKILGREVILVVVQAQGKDGGEFSRIDSVRPPRMGGTRQAQPPRATPEAPQASDDSGDQELVF